MKNALIALWVLLTLGLLGTTGYLFMQNRDLDRQINETTEEKNERLVNEINKVFDLPDETPVVAIVTDKEQFISEYPVFENAESGDYLLFFRKARLNVLYRQSEKRVVKTAQVAVPISIELIGSKDAIAEAESQLQELEGSVTLVKTVNTGIAQSLIYDVDQDQADETSQLADRLEIKSASTLPDTITPGDTTEIVILLADSSAPESTE